MATVLAGAVVAPLLLEAVVAAVGWLFYGPIDLFTALRGPVASASG